MSDRQRLENLQRLYKSLQEELVMANRQLADMRTDMEEWLLSDDPGAKPYVTWAQFNSHVIGSNKRIEVLQQDAAHAWTRVRTLEERLARLFDTPRGVYTPLPDHLVISAGGESLWVNNQGDFITLKQDNLAVDMHLPDNVRMCQIDNPGGYKGDLLQYCTYGARVWCDGRGQRICTDTTLDNYHLGFTGGQHAIKAGRMVLFPSAPLRHAVVGSHQGGVWFAFLYDTLAEAGWYGEDNLWRVMFDEVSDFNIAVQEVGEGEGIARFGAIDLRWQHSQDRLLVAFTDSLGAQWRATIGRGIGEGFEEEWWDQEMKYELV